MMIRICIKLTTALILLLIGIADWRTMEIPDRFQLALAGCGVISVFAFPETEISERMIGFFCVSAPMLLLCLLVDGAFGGGDIKLAAVMGFYLGWRRCFVGTVIGFFIGGIQAAILLIRGKVKYGERAHMALGPALCAGFFVADYYGISILKWYFGFFTAV